MGTVSVRLEVGLDDLEVSSNLEILCDVCLGLKHSSNLYFQFLGFPEIGNPIFFFVHSPSLFVFLSPRNLALLSSYLTTRYGAVSARRKFPSHFLLLTVSGLLPLHLLTLPTLAQRKLFGRSDVLFSRNCPESPLRELSHAASTSLAVWPDICLLSQ